jgi:hypothetical protein
MAKKLGTTVTILFLPFLLFPQEKIPQERISQEKPRFRLYPLVVEGIGAEEAKNIESLFISYLEDIGFITGWEEPGFETGDSGLSPPQTPLYSMTGRLRQTEYSRFLDLEITDESFGERYFFSCPFKNPSELILQAHSALSRAFSADHKALESVLQERIGAEQVWGTWKSGGSIQMIRLERNGTGMVLFSSGAVMRLRYTIEDDILIVVQDSPNNERFYHPLPRNVARELAKKAEPMRWELLLSDWGMTLRGIVVFTEALYDGNTLKGVNQGKTDATEWQRSR